MRLLGADTMARKNGKVRYAVVGLGYISQIAILPAFAHARSNSVLTALVSGDPKKLKSLSRKYGTKYNYSYEQYAECLASGEIDAVYIALPNHMHRAYTEAAARAGIHVLCEKPMALEEADCQAMIAEVERSKVKLMIAYRLHFERGNLHAVEYVNSGKLGEPKVITSVFSQQVRPGNSRLQKDVGGGAVYDMGVYCINAARYLFRAEPEEVFAWNFGRDNERFREVPATTTGLLKFPGDRLASFTCSFGVTDRSIFEVIGTKGVLKMDPAFEMVESLKTEITQGDRKQKKTFPKRDQFAAELVYFSDCVLKDKNAGAVRRRWSGRCPHHPGTLEISGRKSAGQSKETGRSAAAQHEAGDRPASGEKAASVGQCASAWPRVIATSCVDATMKSF